MHVGPRNVPCSQSITLKLNLQRQANKRLDFVQYHSILSNILQQQYEQDQQQQQQEQQKREREREREVYTRNTRNISS